LLATDAALSGQVEAVDRIVGVVVRVGVSAKDWINGEESAETRNVLSDAHLDGRDGPRASDPAEVGAPRGSVG